MICLITQHHSPIYFSTRFTRRESKTVDPFRTSEFIRSFWWSSYNFILVFWGSVLRKWLLVVSCFWLSLASSQSLFFLTSRNPDFNSDFILNFVSFWTNLNRLLHYPASIGILWWLNNTYSNEKNKLILLTDYRYSYKADTFDN